MIIGNPNRFAIEFSVDEPHDRWLFGKLCYRVAGRMIGNYEMRGTLNGAVGAFMELLKFKGNRREDSLIGRPASEAYHRIDGALYIDSGQSDLQVKLDWAYFCRFHADPVGFDVFDHWKCYLIEDNRIGRFLWKDLRVKGEAEVSEAILAAGEFDHIISDYVNYMQSTYQECGRGE